MRRVNASSQMTGVPALPSLVTLISSGLVVVVSIITVRSPTYGIAVIVVTMGLALTIGRPTAVLLVTLLIAQEIQPSDGQFGGLTSLGHQVYYFRVAPITLLALLAACIALFRMGKPSLTAGGKGVLALSAILAAATTVVALYHGQSLFSAFNQTARPFVLLVCGFTVGTSVCAIRGEQQVTVRAATVALASLAIGAVLAAAAGQSADPSVSRLFIYYDSATAAAAGAVLLALLFSRRSNKWRLLLAFATATIVIVGFRRNVWVAVAAAFLTSLLVSRARPAVWRPLGLATIPIAAGLALFPSVAGGLASRMANAWYTITGDSYEDSTASHILDIEIGWRYVQEHFWMGVGPDAPQLTGLVAVNSTRVYVHNEWLLDWLRFGFLGFALVAALSVLLVGSALGAVRHGGTDIVHRSAAMFLLIAPVSMVTAPFMSTTARWPLLIGLAAGLLATARSSVAHRSATSYDENSRRRIAGASI